MSLKAKLLAALNNLPDDTIDDSNEFTNQITAILADENQKNVPNIPPDSEEITDETLAQIAEQSDSMLEDETMPDVVSVSAEEMRKEAIDAQFATLWADNVELRAMIVEAVAEVKRLQELLFTFEGTIDRVTNVNVEPNNLATLINRL